MTDSRSYPELESERRPVADVLQELSDVIEAVRGDRDLIRVSGLRGGPEDIGIISIDSLQEDLKRACTELRSFTVAQSSGYPGSSGLLPCPFCGGSRVGMASSIDATEWGVLCSDCGSSCSTSCDSHDEAVTSWNRRSGVPAQAKPDYGAEAQFLLDRLDEFDPGEEDAEREYHGHVAPAIARLRSALSSTDREAGR